MHNRQQHVLSFRAHFILHSRICETVGVGKIFAHYRLALGNHTFLKRSQATDRENIFILTMELSPLSILQYEIWPFATIGAECKFSESSGLVACLLNSGQRKLTFQVELDGGRSPRPPVV